MVRWGEELLNNISLYVNKQQPKNSTDYNNNGNNNINIYHNHYPSGSVPYDKAIISKITENVYCKRVLIVDDQVDVTVTFKLALENNNDEDAKIFEVYTYNDPLLALSEFKQNFYDLMLLDINMPSMNGFEFCEKILKLDMNVKVCFISAAEINHEALREIYPSISIGCFIKKPVTIDSFVERLKAELDLKSEYW
jgi:CheY-like chemotaxis protein